MAWNDTSIVNRFGLDQPRHDPIYNNFYSGSDVYVFVVRMDKTLIPIPVAGFAFGISQEKMPIFGAWSYKYDVVADGTRIVQGQFSILFVEPNHIGRLLANDTFPDHSLLSDTVNNPIDLVDPEHSIQRRAKLKDDIWGSKTGTTDQALVSPSSTLDPHMKANKTRRESYPFGRDGSPPALYAAHPPFDIMIAFGANPIYSNGKDISSYTEFSYDAWVKSTRDYLKMTEDMNDKNMFNAVYSERVYIEDVHLMNSGISMDTSGQPLIETYSFMAQDVRTPNVG
jgi:hypothetical protein